MAHQKEEAIATLMNHVGKRSQYIRSGVRGRCVTYQVHPAGSAELRGRGYRHGSTIDAAELRRLRQQKLIFTGGGGLGPETPETVDTPGPRRFEPNAARVHHIGDRVELRTLDGSARWSVKRRGRAWMQREAHKDGSILRAHRVQWMDRSGWLHPWKQATPGITRDQLDSPAQSLTRPAASTDAIPTTPVVVAPPPRPAPPANPAPSTPAPADLRLPCLAAATVLTISALLAFSVDSMQAPAVVVLFGGITLAAMALRPATA